ncbi:MAG: DUF342 domain-containing protein [Planctomycetes bacterium]|nr:DUF342 domain-containing protein [Planctomycetota bacterium]
MGERANNPGARAVKAGRTRSPEGGVALIVALVVILLILGLVASYLAVSTSNLRLTATSHDSLQALYVAETGLTHALHELNSFNLSVFKDANGNPAPTNGPYSGAYTIDGTYKTKNDQGEEVTVGDFHVEAEFLSTDPQEGDIPSCAKLAATGTYNGFKRTVEASVVYVPNPRITHGVLVDGDLTIHGNLTVKGDVHANGELRVNGGSAEILAADPTLSDLTSPPYPGAYAGNLTACRGVLPVNCYVAGVLDTNAAAVPVPGLVPYVLVSKAQELGWLVDQRTPPGPQYTERWQGNPSSDADLMAPDGVPGKLIMVEGDVKLTGKVTGDVIIVATGNIDITGSVSWGGGAGDGCHTIIVAQGDIKITGNANVTALLMADGAVTAMGNATINGGVIAGNNGGDLENRMGGSLSVNYVRPSANVENLLKKWKLLIWRQAGSDEGDPGQ